MIPVYLNTLGPGAYGLVGFYVNLVSFMVFLDLGLGYAAMKIIAEISSENRSETIGLLRLIEKIYLLISLVIGVSIFASSQWIASKWLTVDAVGIDGVFVIRLMALLLCVSWPISLFQSFLYGKKEFIEVNIVNCGVELMLAVLHYFLFVIVKKDINAYFVTTIVIRLLQVVGLRVLAWKGFERAEYASISKVKSVSAYSAGASFYSISSLLMLQLPILYISFSFPSSTLALYIVATSVPFALITFLYPITSALFPRVVKINSDDNAVQCFERSLYFICLISFSLFGIGWNDLELLYEFWLGSRADIGEITDVSRYLILGAFVQTIRMVATTTLVANGKTTMIGVCNGLGLVALVFSLALQPEMITGVARAWVIMNFIVTPSVLMCLAIIYRNLMARWLKIIVSYFGALLLGFIVTRASVVLVNLDPIVRIVYDTVVFGLFALVPLLWADREMLQDRAALALRWIKQS